MAGTFKAEQHDTNDQQHQQLIIYSYNLLVVHIQIFVVSYLPLLHNAIALCVCVQSDPLSTAVAFSWPHDFCHRGQVKDVRKGFYFSDRSLCIFNLYLNLHYLGFPMRKLEWL